MSSETLVQPSVATESLSQPVFTDEELGICLSPDLPLIPNIIIESVALNDHDATMPEPEISRTVIRKVTITLVDDATVTASDVAIRQRDGGGLVGLDTVTISEVAGKTKIEITFNGGTHTDTVIDPTSLEDGNYEIIIYDRVEFGSVASDLFYRLLGDCNHDGVVNISDYTAYATSLVGMRPNPPYRGDFDFDNDGYTNFSGYAIIGRNVGASRDLSGY